jgi:polysaccharide biosynthesis/export protein
MTVSTGPTHANRGGAAGADCAAEAGGKVIPVLSARWRLLAPALLGAAALAGCAGPGADLPPLPAAPATDYLLGPGDRVRIITFGDQQMTGEFRVNDSGDIAVPLLGNVRAQGLTSKQLEARVAGALQRSGLFKTPSVSIEVVAYRPIFVLGEVNRPGQYPYQPGMTAVTAVAVAGGFTYRAVQSVFSVVRTTSGRAVEDRAMRQSFLEPGDVLTVYERYF